ncbi:hypothetical protein CNBD2690 [Cryptococcus deneoformans B-3501A]|uniref:Expressed protein n=1 Tax=Cryptococcus deneoformans (strain JEC21 / ATCC MYA-565) TaxID=214684 RepID=Q5KIA6_CRYD1|nr:expressed protein [Cryptococcus neoformans var. neoformans JEC21]XP_775860.1 hypothetical protein CNBD2690 [Cryptococcus neoformans var. neoformans B-3501A]AAW43265.1 expressed protein [Cryptococcus neoformans var. neoformans JEC21]EAL21213.1 hypothetical protein CNBD2690 [Cryptococcus neoformans var. neoformans B-3501A]
MSATSDELVRFFPSATHEALPISIRILSTLRNLTGPGKGNELKSEERAALVGVAAVLACEQIQSKDLPEQSAQKASSVSASHFRSALSLSRRLLSQQASMSPQDSRNKRGDSEDAASLSSGGGLTTQEVLALVTPKTKRYSDFSLSESLANRPVRGSPLRQSVARVASSAPKGQLGPEVTPGRSETASTNHNTELTPTKSAKFVNPRGINLEHPQSSSIPHGKRKRNEDASPFFALRPAMSSAAYPSRSATETNRVKGMDTEDGQNSSWLRRLPEPQISKVQQQRTNAKRRRNKRDWTFSEHCEEWKEGKVSVDEIMIELSDWMKKQETNSGG